MKYVLVILAGPFASAADCEAAKHHIEAEVARYECHAISDPAPEAAPLPAEKPEG